MKNKTAYWAIYQNKISTFEGSFTECWNALVNKYGHLTLNEIVASGIKIARIR